MSDKAKLDCREALSTLLDHVDYISGACRANEMVGAALPPEIIQICRDAVATAIDAAKGK